MQAVRTCLKRLASLLVTEYEAYFIYATDAASVDPQVSTFTFSEIDSAALDAAGVAEIRHSRSYAGDDAAGFALSDGARPSCVAWFWHGKRYESRNFWPLAASEAKLVQIVCDPAMRGRGLAPLLLDHCVSAMAAKGFNRLYARIWFSNRPSVRAFRKAGWQRIAFVLAGRVRGFDQEFRIVLGSRPSVGDSLMPEADELVQPEQQKA